MNYANVTFAVWLFLWPGPLASQLQRGIEAWNSKDYDLALNWRPVQKTKCAMGKKRLSTLAETAT
jgi:hypothetical protein